MLDFMGRIILKSVRSSQSQHQISSLCCYGAALPFASTCNGERMRKWARTYGTSLRASGQAKTDTNEVLQDFAADIDVVSQSCSFSIFQISCTCTRYAACATAMGIVVGTDIFL